MLSTVCTLLAVHHLSIAEARIFTSDPPAAEPGLKPMRQPRTIGTGRLGGSSRMRPTSRRKSTTSPSKPDRRRKIIDVFQVRRVDGSTEAPDWTAFEEELSALAQLLRQGQHDEVYHRLLGRFAAALGDQGGGDGPLEPIVIHMEPQGPDHPTQVAVRSRDTFGFLSLTASALALSGIRIVRADVRTDAQQVMADDTLWITDRSSRPITDENRLLALKHALILIEHFSTRLPLASDPEAALVHFSRFANDLMARPDRLREFDVLDRPEVLDALVRVLGESRFLWEDYLHAQPETVLPLIGNPDGWRRRRAKEELSEILDVALASEPDHEGRVRAVRQFKDREIFRADVRTILGLSGGPEGFAQELTEIAEVLMQATLDLAVERLGPKRPRSSEEQPVPIALCALGKFGGRELGFASDLELMLIFDDRDIAETPDDGPVADYFDRLVSALRQVLGIRRGSTFELDFRLRPYGKGGPPATPLSLFADYYRAEGAAWTYERQALIRLRAIAGDPELGHRLEAHRDNFVYGPEPFDIDGLRRMRQLQIKQLVDPSAINAKFSPGALVDVEYVVQAYQIVFGRSDPRLQHPNTLDALAALESQGHVPHDDANTLREGFRFFRALIGALRVVRGHAEDLTVPPFDSEAFAMLARRLRWPGGPDALSRALRNRLETTHTVVEQRLDALAGAEQQSSGQTA